MTTALIIGYGLFAWACGYAAAYATLRKLARRVAILPGERYLLPSGTEVVVVGRNESSLGYEGYVWYRCGDMSALHEISWGEGQRSLRPAHEAQALAALAEVRDYRSVR